MAKWQFSDKHLQNCLLVDHTQTETQTESELFLIHCCGKSKGLGGWMVEDMDVVRFYNNNV